MKKSELRAIIKEEYDKVLNEASSPMGKIMMFALNYPHDFIEKTWEDEPRIATHLRKKFDGFYKQYGSNGVFPVFYASLDSGNTKKLEDWISKNFRG